MQKKYHTWTESEKNYILNAVKGYGEKINWIEIQENLPHRTTQQCKSFYHNMKQQHSVHQFQKANLERRARMALIHILTADTSLKRDNDKQASVDQVTSDILLNVFLVQAGNYKCGLDLNLIALAREMIIVFNQVKSKMIEEIYINGHAVFDGCNVSHQQLDSVIKLATMFKIDDLFLQLSAVVANSKFQK
ncbi:SANT/Myb_domain [Hexamita inflata]|uniref:SANT/Myb domain n=1 Tax=Hexamita inflata TaxID=28002 RepID=A0AA86P735_9EUKA|nr:SANT/Myb domain [Hexamita inflata]CAI9967277.1 SANT/Myb domain [Hexamita inflata]